MKQLQYDPKAKEYYDQRRQALRNIASNPILSEETKKEIRLAAYCMDDYQMYVKRIEYLQEQIENMKKARTYER